MKNSEILKEILRLAEEEHINLYHDISKQQIESYIKTIKNLDELDEIQFDYEMLKLFNKFKDAHTSYYVKYKYLNKKLLYIEDKLIFKEENNFYEVTHIADLNVKEFIKKLKEMINYETEEYLIDSIRAVINNFYYYEMLGLSSNNNICLAINKNNKKDKVNLNQISIDDYKILGFKDNLPNYTFNLIDDNILYIKYKKCFEHKDYPFSEFVNELRKQIERKDIKKYILDLRDNHGGDSSIIKPLIELVKEKELDGALIINNGVFSSGRWAIADFKKSFNTPTFGEPTGGAAASYGYNKNLQVENKQFSVSIRYWDFSEIFKTKGTIKPDFYVALKLEDIKKGIDTQLEVCIKYLLNKFEKNL